MTAAAKTARCIGPSHPPHRIAACVIVGLMLALNLAPVVTQAQANCPPVERVLFPVDRAAFANVQGFAARSPRHNGRYHTGEDWALLDGSTRGQPVRAMANGRVTYAYPQGWGRDGGVIILEHTLPDDSVWYSVYGHLTESESVRFPAGSVCVAAGETLGVIADARPAPHLHLEVRAVNGGTPGSGYLLQDPRRARYVAPSVFVDHTAAELTRQVQWITRLDNGLGPLAAPIPLNDDSLLVLQPGSISRVLPDGRIFWRTTFDRPAVALSALQGQSLLHYADGSTQVIGPDGTLGERWQLPIQPTAAPFQLGEELVFPTAGGWAALGNRRREIVWDAPAMPLFWAAHPASRVIGVRTASHDLITLERGTLSEVDRATLQPGTGVFAAAGGDLLVYAQTGLWRVGDDGTWAATPHAAPIPSGVTAVRALPGGDALLYDGETLQRRRPTGEAAWAFSVGAVRGRAELDWYDDRALLIATDGTLYTVDPLLGECRVQLAPAAPGAVLWSGLADDDVLRVMIGPTIAALDWAAIRSGCGAG